MGKSAELVHKGRRLQIQASVLAGDWQVWIYEDANRVYLHSLVANDQAHELDTVIQQARNDVETGAIIVPVVRGWPRVGQAQDEAR